MDNSRLIRERGWALVSTLWVLSILAMMAAAIQELSVTSSRIGHHAIDSAQLDADINAAVVRTILALDDPRLDQRWAVNGSTQLFAFGGRTMRISIQDQSGLIDINKASQATLAALIATAGLGENAGKSLAANIVDWREPVGPDYPDRPTGTTDGLYANLGYHPRHGPFQTVAELKLVAGMTADLYARIAPLVTVYSKKEDVDLSASPPALVSLMSSAGSPQGSQPSSGTPEQPLLDTVSTPLASPVPPGALSATTKAAGRSFSIDIAITDGSHLVQRRIVVLPTGDNQRPYLVEAWR